MDVEVTDPVHRVSEVLPSVIAAFKQLDTPGRQTLFRTISALFDLQEQPASPGRTPSVEEAAHGDRFSKDRQLTPKEFLLKKQPRTDVERVACLAYFLSQYNGQKHFKTLDISKLNTDAAQVKFSNAAVAVDNATKAGFLVQAVKGNKQMSAVGELFVEALPDRDAARDAMLAARPRRRTKKFARPSRTKVL
jgi:hypothetical protein